MKNRIKILREKFRLLWNKSDPKTRAIIVMLAVLFTMIAFYFIYLYWLAILFIAAVVGISYWIVKRRIEYRRTMTLPKKYSIETNKRAGDFTPTELVGERNGFRVYRHPDGSCSIHKNGQLIIDNLTPDDAIDYIEQASPAKVIYQQQSPPKQRSFSGLENTPIDPNKMNDSLQKMFGTDSIKKMTGRK